MNKAQFENLSNIKPSSPSIKGVDIPGGTPGTLLMGYTIERNAFHVYLDQDKKINVAVYRNDVMIRHQVENSDGIEISALIPDKRVYPEKSNFAFCKILMLRGHSIPFASYAEAHHGNDSQPVYYGMTHEDLFKSKIRPIQINLKPEDIGLNPHLMAHADHKWFESINKALSELIHAKAIEQERGMPFDANFGSAVKLIEQTMSVGLANAYFSYKRHHSTDTAFVLDSSLVPGLIGIFNDAINQAIPKPDDSGQGRTFKI